MSQFVKTLEIDNEGPYDKVIVIKQRRGTLLLVFSPICSVIKTI